MKYLLLLVCCYSSLYAQQVYWVSFTDKDTSFSIHNPQQFLSEKAIQRRQKFQLSVESSDLPVSPFYLSSLSQSGYTILSKSKWLNAATILVPEKTGIEALTKMRFINALIPMGKYNPTIAKEGKKSINVNEWFGVLEERSQPSSSKPKDAHLYGKSKTQVDMLGTAVLHSRGYKGEGVDIAVIDAGFENMDIVPVLKTVHEEKRVKATYDFVEKNNHVFSDDDHGLAVLSCMAGNQPHEYMGTAPNANYYLLRSEIADAEMPVEESYWIEAIEFADSAGVDLVNSSLGYNEFDDPTYNHIAKDLDGKTTFISIAANMAVQKGMVVVVSAGNEGDEDWKYISVPADAEQVITVGGVDATKHYASFSSLGTSKRKRIKPDMVAMGDNVWVASSRGILYQGDGTSYSSPILAGSIACLMQAYPNATPTQLMKVLCQSGDQYFKPDQYLGYGVPDMQLAFLLLQDDTSNMIVDVRGLSDHRIHLTYRVSSPQKLEVLVTNEQGLMVLTESLNVKEAGVNRLPLKKIKSLPKGKYTLRLTRNVKEQTVTFRIQ